SPPSDRHCRPTGPPRPLAEILAEKPGKERRAAIAERIGTSPDRLAAWGKDRSLHVDSCGDALFVEPAHDHAEPSAETAAAAEPAAPPGTDPFGLSSDPASPLTIY